MSPMLALPVAAGLPVGAGHFMLYLSAVLVVAALIYLGYAMIRPERF
jgi:K+-transporting ATPase KdpF subunit